jgi:streptomycin 6-kinase
VINLEIPMSFSKKLISCFGEIGEDWLERLPQIHKTCLEKWELTDCRLVDNLTVNLVCFATSPLYGEVVLKIEGPHPEAYGEMMSLSLFDEENVCKCHVIDLKNKAMLLERIVPGDNLTSVKNKTEQLRIGADLISTIPKLLKDDYEIPTYAQWISRTFDTARKEKKVNSVMLELIHEAEILFNDLEASDREKVLLHGDLHHENILKDKNNRWKAIDPHGIIGVRCMECARFIDNHVISESKEEAFDKIDEVVNVFSAKFNEPKRVIASCTFILRVLSACWIIEESNPETEKLNKAITNCEAIYNYLLNLN